MVVLGDFNARVGTKDQAWSEEVGQFGLPEGNEAGEKLLQISGENRLRVANTFFKHNQYGSWIFPRNQTWYSLDHVLVRARDLKRVKDARVLCDAECDTDHGLLVLDIKTDSGLWRKGTQEHKDKGNRLGRLEVDKLKDTQTIREVQEKIHGKMQELCKGALYHLTFSPLQWYA